jgi:hypothetical protein
MNRTPNAVTAMAGKKSWTSKQRWYSKISLSKSVTMKGGDRLGSVIKKRRKKMRKHKHRKLLARTRHQRRKGK